MPCLEGKFPAPGGKWLAADIPRMHACGAIGKGQAQAAEVWERVAGHHPQGGASSRLSSPSWNPHMTVMAAAVGAEARDAQRKRHNHEAHRLDVCWDRGAEAGPHRVQEQHGADQAHRAEAGQMLHRPG